MIIPFLISYYAKASQKSGWKNPIERGIILYCWNQTMFIVAIMGIITIEFNYYISEFFYIPFIFFINILTWYRVGKRRWSIFREYDFDGLTRFETIIAFFIFMLLIGFPFYLLKRLADAKFIDYLNSFH